MLTQRLHFVNPAFTLCWPSVYIVLTERLHCVNPAFILCQPSVYIVLTQRLYCVNSAFILNTNNKFTRKQIEKLTSISFSSFHVYVLYMLLKSLIEIKIEIKSRLHSIDIYDDYLIRTPVLCLPVFQHIDQSWSIN